MEQTGSEQREEGEGGQEEQPQAAGADRNRVERLLMQLRLIFAVRHAQNDPLPAQLMDHLFLGSIGAAMNKVGLKDLGITHVLTVADKMAPMFPAEFTYMKIDLLDSIDANLLEILPGALDFIESVKESGGKVLVHCFAGKSRSSSVCLAYLMKTQHISLLDALRFVREKRPVVMPNTGFLNQLKQFEVSLGIPPGVDPQ